MNKQFEIQHLFMQFRKLAYDKLSKNELKLFEDSLELPFAYLLAQYKKHHNQHMYVDETRLFKHYFVDFETTENKILLLNKLNNLIENFLEIKTVTLNELFSFVNRFNDTYSGMFLRDFVSSAFVNGFKVLHSENNNTLWYNDKNTMLLTKTNGKYLSECHLLFVKNDMCLPLVYHSQDSISFYDRNFYNYRFHRISNCNNIFRLLSESQEYIDSDFLELDLKLVWDKFSQKSITDIFNHFNFATSFFNEINEIYSTHF